MEDLYESIRKRKSVRKYSDKPISEDILNEIREDISHKDYIFRKCNYRFELIDYKNSGAQKGFLFGIGKIEAPNCIVAIGDTSKESILNIGFYLEKEAIKLTSMGIATCWSKTYDVEKLNKICNIGSSERIECILILGYEDEKQKNKKVVHKRKPISEICSHEQYGLSLENYLDNKNILKNATELSSLAPSAFNKQPTRIIFNHNKVIFVCRNESYIDVGIFMSHFYLCCEKNNLKPRIILERDAKGVYNIPEKRHYIATMEFGA